MLRRDPRKGEFYKHFKGHIIEIICIAKDTETMEETVIYKHTGTNEFWSRPKDMFMERLDKTKYPNATQEYRFELIDNKYHNDYFPKTKRILFASNNPGKVKEIKEMLEPFGFSVTTLEEEHIKLNPEENGLTYKENAFIKANAAMEYLKDHGRENEFIVLADDAGIEVEQLNGRPGIYTHRATNGDPTKLLREIDDSKGSNAKLVCAHCALFYDDGILHKYDTTGALYGHISTFVRGTNGYGLYPIFIPEFTDDHMHLSRYYGKLKNPKTSKPLRFYSGYTLGEIDSVITNAINHRYASLSKMFKLPSSEKTLSYLTKSPVERMIEFLENKK